MNLENLYFNTTPAPFNKVLKVPTSKSFANRALILAAINEEEIILNEMPESTDVKNMIRCLRSVGVEIIENGSSIIVKNSFPECEIPSEDIVTLHTGDGGTTNRFIIPLLALGTNKYELIASEKMLERPMDELDEVLTSLGVNVERSEDIWFQVQGPYVIDRLVVDVDCARSTQFATGLALSLSKLNVDVTPLNLHTSQPYWEMTVNLIEKFEDDTIFDVPVDFSSLSYPLALATMGGSVTVTNCRGVDRFQADSAFIYILEKLNVDIDFTHNGFVLNGKDILSPLNEDCRSCPDLVPTLCFIASYAQGTSRLSGVEVLRHKECDRLDEMLRMMASFGVKSFYEEETDSLVIEGRSPHSDSVDYNPPVDHRMVMVAYMFQRFNGGGQLSNSECVAKSFPTFFNVME